ncbi:hypothetical protein VNO77_41843 [Canavalia gladiata]|uniref:Uncharacterized protein n=1 Tax=Canavalia gladiata TaxID=3824 RepID=A0AAN9PRW3_CANGL
MAAWRDRTQKLVSGPSFWLLKRKLSKRGPLESDSCPSRAFKSYQPLEPYPHHQAMIQSSFIAPPEVDATISETTPPVCLESELGNNNPGLARAWHATARIRSASRRIPFEDPEPP